MVLPYSPSEETQVQDHIDGKEAILHTVKDCF